MPDKIMASGYARARHSRVPARESSRENHSALECSAVADVELVKPEDGAIQGVVSHIIFKGVHYEMEVQADIAVFFQKRFPCHGAQQKIHPHGKDKDEHNKRVLTDLHAG